jgi:predicted nuclease of predicted toxin-antitoxin system
MRILLDECLPRRLGRALAGHDVMTVPAMGWAAIKNGALLRLADASFDVFITVDRNLQYQQSLRGLKMAIIVLSAPSNRIGALQPLMSDVSAILEQIQPGDVVQVGTLR